MSRVTITYLNKMLSTFTLWLYLVWLAGYNYSYFSIASSIFHFVLFIISFYSFDFQTFKTKLASRANVNKLTVNGLRFTNGIVLNIFIAKISTLTGKIFGR